MPPCRLDMTDMGEPGSSDQIAITVWNKSGGLWFASRLERYEDACSRTLSAGGNLVVPLIAAVVGVLLRRSPRRGVEAHG